MGASIAGETIKMLLPYFPPMRAKEAREISISEYLGYAGIKPAKQRLSGRELWYSSPIRNGDSHPSFKVDTVKNLWFDFGLKRGGNVVDLVCELTNSTVAQALAILEKSGANRSPVYPRSKPSSLPAQNSKPLALQAALFSSDDPLLSSTESLPKTTIDEQTRFAGEKEKSAFEILGVSSIKNRALIAYLKARNIDLNIAHTYLKEVHFKPMGKAKAYFALGFPSGDGFEVRSKVFKGFVGTHKDLATLNLANNKSLSIFEGFMDFLAFLSYYKLKNFQNSVIILNSINLRDHALKIVDQFQFSKVYLFLDNDKAGNETKQFFLENIKNTPVSDKSVLYQNHTDFNQMTMEPQNHV